MPLPTAGAWARTRSNKLVSSLFSAEVDSFSQTPIDEICGALSAAASRAGLAATPEQVSAWETTIRIVGSALKDVEATCPNSSNWGVLFEYSIPRRRTRPDVVILSEGVVVVLEMKVGATRFNRADQIQATDYAKDLRDFHEQSHGLPVIPVLCATKATVSNIDLSASDPYSRAQLVAPQDLSELILAIQDAFGTGQSIDIETWDSSRYRPTPNILESAIDLYRGQDVREISHAHADNLTETTAAIQKVIEDARDNRRKVVCFVTGVPGSGKTLAGLAAVHSATGTYLSGNGPLVNVLQYALSKDLQKREPIDGQEANRRASVFIQPVHGFIGELANSESIPPENVIVFDEAQRAWDEQRMGNKQNINKSEAAVALSIMSRCPDWAVIVALIGDGQEINTGEAGIQAWMEAIQASPEWSAVVPPALPQAIPNASIVPSLHLSVGVRAPRAQALSDWVDSVLSGNAEQARFSRPIPSDYEIVLTRSLGTMRDFLTDRASADRRTGLLASAQARRLRPFGIEMSGAFQGDINWPRWFVDGQEDVRSSYSLEVAASEFKCQGLEIDLAGLCWGSDFLRSAEGWRPRRMRGHRWVNDSTATMATNRYRVLLTRARYGLAIWLPKPTKEIALIDAEALDMTADFLANAGAVSID